MERMRDQRGRWLSQREARALGEMGRAFQDDLDLLRVLKQLKYFWNLPKSHLAILLEQLSRRISSDEKSAPFTHFQAALASTKNQQQKIKDIALAILHAEVLPRVGPCELFQSPEHQARPEGSRGDGEQAR